MANEDSAIFLAHLGRCIGDKITKALLMDLSGGSDSRLSKLLQNGDGIGCQLIFTPHWPSTANTLTPSFTVSFPVMITIPSD